MIFLLRIEFENTLTIKTNTPDNELIVMLKGTQSERNIALKQIYGAYKDLIYSFILKNSGDQERAKDVYQESLIAFYENVRDSKFKGESAISTYLYSIAKFKWLNQIKKDNVRTKHHEKLEINDFVESPLATIVRQEKRSGIMDVLSELGESCKRLLIESIYHNKSMKEIAKEGNYSNDQIVRNKKYKCLQKLKDLISAKPALRNILQAYE